MPRGDRTGPAGLGPMTGRGAGFCAGSGVPGYANPGPGRGWGRGGGWGGGWGRGGRGHGWRHGYYATGLPGWARGGWPGPWGPAPYAPPAPWPQNAPDDVGDAESLREQAGYLEEALANVRKRLDELESSGDE
jgi:hypothetical protein